MKPRYLVTIGLEVHVQLNTRTKMFCACAVAFGSEPNTLVCPVCLGLPGALPVINRVAVEKTILAGLMLGCKINEIATWDRKNYFYPDMPKNYQISQFDRPLCLGGGVPLYDLAYPKDVQKSIARPNQVIRLTRIHLEEDVGKSTHVGRQSALDFNRAGSALMEIVSEPEIATAEEAVAFLGSLRQILVYAGVSDADMEKGQMRCDVNLSIRPEGQTELGAKVELKNLNSISAVRRAVRYETERQMEEAERGIGQVQSTRRWDDDAGETQLMRTKEDAHDYRYFSDPDLLPVLSGQMAERIRTMVPETPHARRSRLENEFGLTAQAAGVLCSTRSLADFFEVAASGAKSPKRVANWIINDLLATLNQGGGDVSDTLVSSVNLRDLTDAIESCQITHDQAKEVFADMVATGRAPSDLIGEKGFESTEMDRGELNEFIEKAFAVDPAKVAAIQAGNAKLLNWLVGQVMKISEGKVNPKVVTEVLKVRLGLD